MFKTEAEMIEHSRISLTKTFNISNESKICEEVTGLFGIPDVVIISDKVIAIEYKLSNWKRALQQAFKYKNFSNESYVILDESYIQRATKNIDMFMRSNIGLGYVDSEGDIKFCYVPKIDDPYSKKMYNNLLESTR